MRVGLITTLNVNIGDRFIREGICLVLREVFRDREMEFVAVNKHEPLTVYPDWHPVHLAKLTHYLPRGRTSASRLVERLASRLRFSAFDTCDLIVQCGAPVFWPGCHRCEWAEPLWHHVVGRLSERIPVLNLAMGSCYPWERRPTRIDDPRDAEYLRAILDYCRLTTVRDTLAQSLCGSLGTQAMMIPCSALLAAGGAPSAGPGNETVLINYMRGGGHYEWDQGIEDNAWRETAKRLIGRLRRRHKLAFLCHNQAEYQSAQELDSTLPRMWPKTPSEYFDQASGCAVALCNRMHASVGLAGMGIPSVAVGTDTRLLMVRAIGLPCLYVKDASVERLEEGLENLLRFRTQWQERLLALRSETWSDYVNAIASATHLVKETVQASR